MENKIKWVKLWTEKHHDSLLKISREEAGDILQNIVRYTSGEKLSDMTPVSEFIFDYIRQDIDSSKKVYENRVVVAQANGKNGGRPKKESEEKNTDTGDRHKFGEWNNVLLSDDELRKLNEEFSKERVSKKIEEMSNYMESKGKTYKNHYVTLRKWLRDDDLKERSSADEGSGEPGKIFHIEEVL